MYGKAELTPPLLQATWAAQEAKGLWDATIYSYSSQVAAAAPVPCVDGFAEVIPGDRNNTFRCSNVRSQPMPVMPEFGADTEISPD